MKEMNNTKIEQFKENQATIICVVGLGYVGLPLVEVFNPLHKPLKKQHRITLQLAKTISYHPAT